MNSIPKSASVVIPPVNILLTNNGALSLISLTVMWTVNVLT